MKKIGVLALQGCVAPHIEHLKRLGATPIEITHQRHLESLDGIILPGGESTTMLRLLTRDGLISHLQESVAAIPTLGICAGAILLAKEVTHPQQASLGAISIRAERNAYGTQRESFQTEVAIEGMSKPIGVDFIRAPKITPLSEAVMVLARHQEEAVLVREKNIFCSAFHTELSEVSALHEIFLKAL